MKTPAVHHLLAALLMVSSLAAVMWLVTPPVMATAPSCLIMLDYSSSMSTEVNGKPRLEWVQSAFPSLLGQIPAGVEVGLYTLGGNCEARLNSPIGVSRETVIAAAQSLSPRGSTPLVEALEEAISILAQREGTRSILMMTDGVSTCRAGDPCDLIREARSQGIDIRIDMVALQLSDNEKAQLECLTTETGGRWLDISDQELPALGPSLGHVAAQIGLGLRAILSRILFFLLGIGLIKTAQAGLYRFLTITLHRAMTSSAIACWISGIALIALHGMICFQPFLFFLPSWLGYALALLAVLVIALTIGLREPSADSPPQRIILGPLVILLIGLSLVVPVSESAPLQNPSSQPTSHVFVVIDVTGSMKPSQLAEAKQITKTIVDSLPNGTYLTIAGFSGMQNTIVWEGALMGDIIGIYRAIDGLQRIIGRNSTTIFREWALEIAQYLQQSHFIHRKVVLLTDAISDDPHHDIRLESLGTVETINGLKVLTAGDKLITADLSKTSSRGAATDVAQENTLWWDVVMTRVTPTLTREPEISSSWLGSLSLTFPVNLTTRAGSSITLPIEAILTVDGHPTPIKCTPEVTTVTMGSITGIKLNFPSLPALAGSRKGEISLKAGQHQYQFPVVLSFPGWWSRFWLLMGVGTTAGALFIIIGLISINRFATQRKNRPIEVDTSLGLLTIQPGAQEPLRIPGFRFGAVNLEYMNRNGTPAHVRMIKADVHSQLLTADGVVIPGGHALKQGVRENFRIEAPELEPYPFWVEVRGRSAVAPAPPPPKGPSGASGFVSFDEGASSGPHSSTGFGW